MKEVAAGGAGPTAGAARRRSGSSCRVGGAAAAAALLVTILATVAPSQHGNAPAALESVNILSGLGNDAEKAIASMRSLWGAAYPPTTTTVVEGAPRAALVRPHELAGSGRIHFQNVDVALTSAGQAALMAQQVPASCACS